ncbi:MAG: DsbA family protein [Alphaproteobacteria bacterium]|nr:DsbA family protein [Alphaproteobacteria bacterium]MDA8029605.1 DsbA family protein [Alphaproteobacteria bacterium]
MRIPIHVIAAVAVAAALVVPSMTLTAESDDITYDEYELRALIEKHLNIGKEKIHREGDVLAAKTPVLLPHNMFALKGLDFEWEVIAYGTHFRIDFSHPALVGNYTVFSPAIVDTTLSEGPPTLGSEDALINVIMFGDLACKECVEFYDQVIASKYFQEKLDRQEIKFTFQYFHSGSGNANGRLSGTAVECADVQGVFEEFFPRLMSRDDRWINKEKDIQYQELVTFARESGIEDEEAFIDCVTHDFVDGKFSESITLAVEQGIVRSPTFLVGSEPLGYLRLNGVLDRVEKDVFGVNAERAATFEAVIESLEWETNQYNRGHYNDYSIRGDPTLDTEFRLYSTPLCLDCVSFHDSISHLLYRYVDRAYAENRAFLDYVHRVEGPNQHLVGMAIECAGEIGGREGFWTMYNYLFGRVFDTQLKQNRFEGKTDAVAAKELGTYARYAEVRDSKTNKIVTGPDVEKCINGGKYASRVLRDAFEVYQTGIGEVKCKSFDGDDNEISDSTRTCVAFEEVPILVVNGTRLPTSGIAECDAHCRDEYNRHIRAAAGWDP